MALALYAGGNFDTAAGVPAKGIAKWDGVAWSPLSSGFNNTAYALAVFDSGPGPELYAAGDFTIAGGVTAWAIAKWNGVAWSAPVGLAVNGYIWTMTPFDDGTGDALYFGGNFAVNSNHDIARWNGQSLTPVPGLSSNGTLRALAGFDDGFGWVCPCSNYGGAGEGCANSSGAGAVLVGEGTSSVIADDLDFAAQQLVPGQAALLYVGNNATGGGDGIPFGDGLRCAGGSVKRLGVRIPGSAGAATWGPSLSAMGNWSAGDTRHFQVWYRDTIGSPCGAQFNYSSGYRVDFTN